MFCRQSIVPWCLKFIPFLAWDIIMHQGHKFDFSTSLYALENVHVVQFWIMHIKCLGNPVNV